MRTRRQAIGATGIALAVVAIIIVAAAGILGIANQSSKDSTGTSTDSVTSANGLEFTMLLNSSTVQQGHVLEVSLNLFNTLSRTNNITGADNWQLTNASEYGGKGGWNCAQNDVFRIEIIKGNYDLNNFSEGTPLSVFVWKPVSGPNQCLYYIRSANSTAPPLSVPWYGQNYYIFSPKSNVAQWITTGEYTTNPKPTLLVNSTGCNPCNSVNQRAVMGETMILKTALFANSTGVYTVIGGDEWGNLLVTHFVVEQAP